MQALAVAGFRGLMLCALLADTVAALALERHLTALHELQAHASCGRVTSVEVSGWGSTGWDKYFKQIERLVASSSSSPPPLPPPPLPSPPPPPTPPPPHHHHHHPMRQHFHRHPHFQIRSRGAFSPLPPHYKPPSPPLESPLNATTGTMADNLRQFSAQQQFLEDAVGTVGFAPAAAGSRRSQRALERKSVRNSIVGSSSNNIRAHVGATHLASYTPKYATEANDSGRATLSPPLPLSSSLAAPPPSAPLLLQPVHNHIHFVFASRSQNNR